MKIPVRVTKHFEFEASHSLVHNYEGPCSNVHGHSYKLFVTVEGVPNIDNGMVIDFKLLKELVNAELVNVIDHTELNNSMSVFMNTSSNNTTCENMIVAMWYALDHVIQERFEGVKLYEIKLYETSGSYATINRDMVYGG